MKLAVMYKEDCITACIGAENEEYTVFFVWTDDSESIPHVHIRSVNFENVFNYNQMSISCTTTTMTY